MKKKVGLTVFVAVCLLVCYVVDQTNVGYRELPRTYGEYQEQEAEAASASKVTGAANGKKAEEENKEKVVEEKERTKTVYLTFDDGPSDNTVKVLKTLDKYGIKATFFVVAEEITKENEDLLREMVADGHVIGVHTYSHNSKKIYASEEACLEDVKKAYDKIYEITGEKPVYYRFPYGSANCYMVGFCEAIIGDLDGMGLTYIDWNVSGEDAVGKPTKSSIMKNIKKFEKYQEPVILLHDGRSNKLTAKILPEIIEKMKAAGYAFDTIDKRSKPYQWPHVCQEKK